jgi:prevent-host-death family protein
VTTSGHEEIVKEAEISELKAKLSGYLATVRRGESILITDRRTPIALLVPYEETEDRLTIEEPTARLAGLKKIRGVQPRRPIAVVKLLRDSRDQR